MKNKAWLIWIGAVCVVCIGLTVSVVKLGSMVEQYKLEKTELQNNLQKAESLTNEYESTITNMKGSIAEIESEKAELELKLNELQKLYEEEIKPVTFNPVNLLDSSGANERKLSIALKDTGLEGLESSYIQAEKEYGVNAIFLCALTAEESGWGKSVRAIRDNNLSGFEVYSDDAVGARFSSKHESIMVTAKLIKEQYLTEGGNYFNGYSIQAVNIRYCPVNGTSWSDNISTIANQIATKINNR